MRTGQFHGRSVFHNLKKGTTVMKSKSSKSKKSVFDTGTNDNYDRENYINGLTIVKTAANSQSANALTTKQPPVDKFATPTSTGKRGSITKIECDSL